MTERPFDPKALSQEEEKAEQETPDTFVYKGITISGVEGLERNGVLQNGDVTTLLDRLPEGFYTYVPISDIRFEDYKLFSVQRQGEIHVVKESELEESDSILRRVRGASSWNSELHEGLVVPSDGKMTIKVFNPHHYSPKKEGETDRDIALSTLAHELGHATWKMMGDYPRYVKYFGIVGKTIPVPQSPYDFSPLLTEWKNLPESGIARFQEYKSDFLREANRVGEEGKVRIPVKELIAEEDFAVSHDHYLYRQDLATLDTDRYGMIGHIYELLDHSLEK